MAEEKIVVEFVDHAATGERVRVIKFPNVKEANTWIDAVRAFDKFVHDVKFTHLQEI